MAKNYMQDINAQPDEPEEPAGRGRYPGEERSIRDFKPSPARVRLQTPPPRIPEARPEIEPGMPPRRKPRKIWLWILIAIVVAVLVGIGAIVAYPSTTITIAPHSQIVAFDASNPLTVYPAASAATGTISYTVVTQVFEDSAVVAASGTEHAEEKATGNVTVYNEYSDQPVRLIKNTRFQSPDGLIFRIPASVDVPGRKGATPGSLSITVFADQTGPNYNIGPTDKFSLPGLKGTPDMFAKVYAKSVTAFSGGFSGDRPGVSPSVLAGAKAEVRNRLNEKAQQLASTVGAGTIALPGLGAVSYETLQPTNEPGGGVRIRERATVLIPVFQESIFARTVAQAVSASAEGQSIGIRFSKDIAAQPVGALNPADIGQQSITFALTGRGQLVWNVDTKALSEALAGREEGAFETIIKGFPAVEEARARITPFWKHSFPKDAEKISLTVQPLAPEF